MHKWSKTKKIIKNNILRIWNTIIIKEWKMTLRWSKERRKAKTGIRRDKYTVPYSLSLH